MYKHQNLIVFLLAGAFLLSGFTYTLGEMKVHLKSGMVVAVPVNKDDIVSITFEEKAQTTKGNLLETLVVPNAKPVKISSATVLESGRWYIIEASGVISDWSHVQDGVDAVWCYAEWRCGREGQSWNQMRIDEKGMPDITGNPIPYNSQHIYRIRYMGQGKRAEFYCSDAQGSWSDNSGSFTVKIYQE